MRPLLAVLLLAAPLVMHSQRPVPPALPSIVLPPALDRVLRDYEKAWSAGDAATLSELFVDNEVVIANTGAVVRGRAAVREQYAGPGGGTLILRAVGYSADETVAHIIGGYATKAGSPDAGTFVLAVKRSSGGKWLIAADMDRAVKR